MANNLTWLLVADSSKAKIYEVHKAKLLQDNANADNLTLVNEYIHHESRMKSADLVSDKLGEFNQSSYGVEKPKVQEAENFAQQLLEQLKFAKQAKAYRDLIFIAPPTFMGMLNKHTPQELSKIVVQTIEKDYTQDSLQELLKKLITHL